MGAEGRAPVRDPPLPRRGACPLSRAGTLGRTKGKGGGSGEGLCVVSGGHAIKGGLKAYR